MNKEDINKYIAQHSLWKGRLKRTIDTGQSPWDVPTVEKDDHCDFGKWLKTIPAAKQNSEHFSKVKDLHATFHIEAAKVLELALAGKKAELKRP